MGSKGLWKHIKGNAVMPKPYAVVDGIPIISDCKTPTAEEKIKT
jgi:hypothetical protein